MHQSDLIDSERAYILQENETQQDLENQFSSDSSLKLKSEKITSTTISSKQSNNKRGPSTPLTSLGSQNIVRRKLTEDIRPNRRLISFANSNNKELLEANYQNWLMRQDLNKGKEIIEFMELERKFMMEES